MRKEGTRNDAANVNFHNERGNSDSNSGVSGASESVANNRANLYMCGENEKGNVAFIDFLGVGAT